MQMIVGYVIYFAEGAGNDGKIAGRNAGAFEPIGGNALNTLSAMMYSRPYATVCIEPVNEIPEWVEN